MAVYSMTGYANASTSTAGTASAALHERTQRLPTRPRREATIGVEMRSVNNRFLDLSLRLPDEFRGAEAALRELVTAPLQARQDRAARLCVSAADDAAPAPRPDQLATLRGLERSVRAQLPDARPLSVRRSCSGAGAPRTRRPRTARDDASLLDAARRCVDGLAEARAREGARLAADPRRTDRPPARAGAEGRPARPRRRRSPAGALPGALARRPSPKPVRPRPSRAARSRSGP